MSKLILGCILWILGVLIFAYFNYDTWHIVSYPYPIVLQILGCAITSFGTYTIFKGIIYKAGKTSKKMRAFIENLKENGEKIEVDLSKCEIKENNYNEEVSRGIEFQMGTVNTQMLDSLSDSSKLIKSVEIDQTVLIYSHIHNGVDAKFISPVIPRSADDLRIKIYLHKTTFLYVDKNDRTKYYFDMGFLKREE